MQSFTNHFVLACSKQNYFFKFILLIFLRNLSMNWNDKNISSILMSKIYKSLIRNNTLLLLIQTVHKIIWKNYLNLLIYKNKAFFYF